MWLKFDGSESREKGVVGTVEEKRERDSGCECWGCRRRNSLLGNGMKERMGHFPLDIHTKVAAAASSGMGALNWGVEGGGQKRMGLLDSPRQGHGTGPQVQGSCACRQWEPGTVKTPLIHSFPAKRHDRTNLTLGSEPTDSCRQHQFPSPSQFMAATASRHERTERRTH